MFPADYRGDLPPPPFLKFELVINEVEAFAVAGGSGATGVMIFQIYTREGLGQKEAYSIAASLASELSRRSVSNLTTLAGGITPVSEPSTLLRHDLSINFSYYGAL